MACEDCIPEDILDLCEGPSLVAVYWSEVHTICFLFLRHWEVADLSTSKAVPAYKAIITLCQQVLMHC